MRRLKDRKPNFGLLLHDPLSVRQRAELMSYELCEIEARGLGNNIGMAFQLISPNHEVFGLMKAKSVTRRTVV